MEILITVIVNLSAIGSDPMRADIRVSAHDLDALMCAFEPEPERILTPDIPLLRVYDVQSRY